MQCNTELCIKAVGTALAGVHFACASNLFRDVYSIESSFGLELGALDYGPMF